MVCRIIIPTKWLFHWEYEPNIFRQTQIYDDKSYKKRNDNNLGYPLVN